MPEPQLLKDKVAIVTGAATGIGESIAQLYAAHGARVYMADRDAGGLKTAAAGVNAQHPGAAEPILCDVTDTAQVTALAQAALRGAGRVDILVNNAGIYPRRAFLEMTERDWDEMQDINLKGVYRCTRAVAPGMAARRSGKIINISSITFHVGVEELTHYVASKGGIVGFTRALARELGPQGVAVNCLTPGAVLVEHEKDVQTEENIRGFILAQSIKRRILPLDIARVCVFLACELSDAMTGQTLNVDGGWYMH